MDLQKKRNSSKKSKHPRTDTIPQIPLAPLLQQINVLKSELASIKSKKIAKSSKQFDMHFERQNFSETQSCLRSPKRESGIDLTLDNFGHHDRRRDVMKQIMFPIRDSEDKINRELTRLYELVKNVDDDHIFNALVKLVTCLNSSIRELDIENRRVLQQSARDPPVNWREQAKIYQQLNNELEKENIDMKHHLAKQMDELQALTYENTNIKSDYEELMHSVEALNHELENSRVHCEGLREERREFEEKIRVYERSIEKKQSELFMYEEDLNFIRMEVEKNKTQKREFEKLFDGLQKEYRELKSRYEIDVDSLTKERNKWKFQCEMRRANEQDSLGQQDQKTHLKKEVESSRKQMTNLIDQIHILKQKLCSEQKKNLTLEEKIFKVSTDNEKLQRNLEYCRLEMKQMGEEIRGIRDESQKYRDMAVKGKLGMKSPVKVQALQEIQDLIRQHKMEEDD